MAGFWQRKQTLILIAVWLIIILIVIGDSVVRNIYGRFGRLDEQISLAEEKFLRLNAILKQAKAVDSQYEKLTQGLRNIQDTEGLLQEIERLARKAGINLLNVKPTATKDEGLYRVYSLRVEMQDDVAAVARFMNMISEEFKGAGIERLQISGQAKDELPKVIAAINAVVFK
ncbi:MAG TPA: type 4a pilus biogenesis protein PilO [Candidatus Omnitrophota bacterium]|nr:type 4a pilus biogenesis protein PilO [Candidatus Omnitrophota bacterium]